MKRGLTGHFEVSRVAGEEIRAFIPFPLPPDPPLDISNSRQKLLERAILSLGRLDSITLLLPDPDLFLYSYVRREAVLSSQIEGTQSSLSDLMLFELREAPGVPVDDVIEVSNYIAALEHGVRRLREGFPFSNRLIKEMHAKLLASGRGSEKSSGDFRRSQSWIGGTRPGNAHFVPPPPAYVEDCMAQLEKFIHDEKSPYPVLIKTALAHVQFETIHPFLDGNGRIGRLIIVILLHQNNILSQPLLYLSLYFKNNRDEYYRRLDLVRYEGDWEAWIDFFLAGVEQTANGAVSTAQRLVKLFEEDGEKINQLKRAAISAMNVFNIFRRRPLLTINEVCRRSRLSFPAASNAIDNLIKLGILDEATGRQRNRIFVYKKYLSILSEGTENLNNYKNILDSEAEKLARFLACCQVWQNGTVIETKLLVAEFRGVRIEVFPREHMPPHFHVCYNSRHATYRIDNCELLEGSLGHREDKIVQYWYLKQGGKKAVQQAWEKTRPGDLQVGRYEGNIFDNRK